MGRDRAAYMREYRANHRTLKRDFDVDVWRESRIAELEEGVRHLKAELAQRSLLGPGLTWNCPECGTEVTSARVLNPTEHVFNSRPFTPVPKGGK